MSSHKSDKNEIQLNWEELFLNAPGGNIITDFRGNIIKVNKTLLTWIGYDKKELEGKKKFQDLLPIGGKIFYETQHIAILKIQGFLNEVNFELLHKNEDRIQVLVNSTLRSQQNDPDHKIIHHLVTPYIERKKLEIELVKAKKQAEVASQAKSNFLSTITHEIRTPINTILGISDFLLQESPKSEQLEMLKILRNSSLNLNELISNILDLNKMEAGRLTLNNKPFDIRTFIHDLKSAFIPAIQKKGLQFIVQIDKEVQDVYNGDSLKLRQILNNLISNALKFTNQGYLKLSIRLTDIQSNKDRLKFSIEDTGIGMNQQELERIFQPFTQANNDILSEFGGTGLGLTITKELINLFDSDLSVNSHPNKGTTFHFEIELSKNIIETQVEIKEDNFSYSFEKLPHARVLIVDDNHSNQFIATRYLKKWAVNYVEIDNGQGAIEVIKKEHFDLVFLDLRMPKMNGYETIATIRKMKNERYKDLPIIAFSASSSFELSSKMKNAGFNDFVLKPIDPAQFHQTIKKFSNTTRSKPNDKAKDNLSTTNSDDYSLSSVRQFYDGEKESIQSYLHLVKIDIQNFIENLSVSQANPDAITIEDTCHNLQTTIQLFNLDKLKKICNSIYKPGLLQDQVKCKSLTDEILKELIKFHSWLSQKCQ